MKIHLSERLALILIAYGGCEAFTTGPGSCLRENSGRSLVGRYGAESACPACIAYAALNTDGEES